MADAGLLASLLAAGLVLMAAVLVVRASAQAARDADRAVFRLEFPRTLTTRQVEAFLATLAGLASPRLGLVGRDAAVVEVVARDHRIEHRLRLPRQSASYFVAQARAAVPALAIAELAEPGARLPRLRLAQELRRLGPDRPLAVPEPAATAATILGAASDTRRGQTLVWQVVVTGGAPSTPPASWALSIAAVLGMSKKFSKSSKTDGGQVAVAIRLGTNGHPELVARLRRASSSVSVPGGRLLPRALPSAVVARRLCLGATPLIESPVSLSLGELAALVAWPIGAPVIPGLVLGGSPQLPVSHLVPRTGRVLGDATVPPVRPVAVSVKASTEHQLLLGPSGSGKSWLAAQLALGDIKAGIGILIIDPKGTTVRQICERISDKDIDRVILVDPTDETRPVPLPLLAAEPHGSPELAADALIGLLRHRFRGDLGPRSTDILTSSLYALAKVPNATLFDLLALWSNAAFRASVVARSAGDPVAASFWAGFEAWSPGERSFNLAAPLNKVRPLLQRATTRNLLAAPRATFSVSEAMSQGRVVLVSLPEGVLGAEATSLIGQVLIARLWSAVQARRSRRPFFVTIDEAARFLDAPTDLGDVLARAREYGVGVSLLSQSLSQLPEGLREIALNSARTRVAFQTSARDAARLAAESPLVTADQFAGLAAFTAIGQVSLGGAVSEPFTFTTRELGPPVPGRLAAVRAASRAR